MKPLKNKVNKNEKINDFTNVDTISQRYSENIGEVDNADEIGRFSKETEYKNPTKPTRKSLNHEFYNCTLDQFRMLQLQYIEKNNKIFPKLPTEMLKSLSASCLGTMKGKLHENLLEEELLYISRQTDLNTKAFKNSDLPSFENFPQFLCGGKTENNANSKVFSQKGTLNLIEKKYCKVCLLYPKNLFPNRNAHSKMKIDLLRNFVENVELSNSPNGVEVCIYTEVDKMLECILILSNIYRQSIKLLIPPVGEIVKEDANSTGTLLPISRIDIEKIIEQVEDHTNTIMFYNGREICINGNISEVRRSREEIITELSKRMKYFKSRTIVFSDRNEPGLNPKIDEDGCSNGVRQSILFGHNSVSRDTDSSVMPDDISQFADHVLKLTDNRITIFDHDIVSTNIHFNIDFVKFLCILMFYRTNLENILIRFDSKLYLYRTIVEIISKNIVDQRNCIKEISQLYNTIGKVEAANVSKSTNRLSSKRLPLNKLRSSSVLLIREDDRISIIGRIESIEEALSQTESMSMTNYSVELNVDHETAQFLCGKRFGKTNKISKLTNCEIEITSGPQCNCLCSRKTSSDPLAHPSTEWNGGHRNDKLTNKIYDGSYFENKKVVGNQTSRPLNTYSGHYHDASNHYDPKCRNISLETTAAGGAPAKDGGCDNLFCKFQTELNTRTIFTITADNLSNIVQACKMLNSEFPSEIVFSVDKKYHKKIIGTSGKNIQKIMKKYDVYVKFMSDQESVEYEGNVICKTPKKNETNLNLIKDEILEIINETSVKYRESDIFDYRNVYKMGYERLSVQGAESKRSEAVSKKKRKILENLPNIFNLLQLIDKEDMWRFDEK